MCLQILWLRRCYSLKQKIQARIYIFILTAQVGLCLQVLQYMILCSTLSAMCLQSALVWQLVWEHFFFQAELKAKDLLFLMLRL